MFPTDPFGLDDLIVAIGIFWLCLCLGIAALQFTSETRRDRDGK